MAKKKTQKNTLITDDTESIVELISGETIRLETNPDGKITAYGENEDGTEEVPLLAGVYESDTRIYTIGENGEVTISEKEVPTKKDMDKKKPASETKPAYPAFLKQYVKAYPAEKVFHITADKQVFLDKDYSLARMHQNSLGRGELETFNL